jgi:hypothetical protein
MVKELNQMFVGKEIRSFSKTHYNSHEIHNNSTSNKQQEYMEHNQYQQNHHQPPISNRYSVELQYDSIVPEAGMQTKLTIFIKEKSGTPVREYELVHDKLMHLIIVGEDLSYFAHIHPVIENNGENFTIVHTFPEAGKYKLWVDFKPKGGIQNILAFMTEVKGLPGHIPITPVHDEIYIKESSDKNYQISLKVPQENIVANIDVDLVFSISDTAGNPVIDLEPLMGAGGHSVIISSDLEEFIHVHPIEEVEPAWKGGPHISFRTSFPKPGLYKAWGQFQHKGKIIIADFIIDVT